MTAAPASLYVGRTMHARLTPFKRRFTYRIASLLVDIDRLDEAGRLSRLFSIDRFNLFSFHRRDHGEGDGGDLRPWAECAFEKAGVSLEGGRIELLSFPRMLGYVFNPLSLWFGHGPSDDLRGVIYAVRNTFGGAHAYVARASANVEQRHVADKIFHVSPFFDTRGRYDFRLTPPQDRFALSIRYAADGKDQMVATQSGARRTLTSGSLAGLFASMPLMTLKVIGGIHWEALHTWRRGATYRSPPPPPPELSLARIAASNMAANDRNAYIFQGDADESASTGVDTGS